jgi:hypothetical protein
MESNASNAVHCAYCGRAWELEDEEVVRAGSVVYIRSSAPRGLTLTEDHGFACVACDRGAREELERHHRELGRELRRRAREAEVRQDYEEAARLREQDEELRLELERRGIALGRFGRVRHWPRSAPRP